MEKRDAFAKITELLDTATMALIEANALGTEHKIRFKFDIPKPIEPATKWKNSSQYC